MNVLRIWKLILKTRRLNGLPDGFQSLRPGDPLDGNVRSGGLPPLPPPPGAASPKGAVSEGPRAMDGDSERKGRSNQPGYLR